jgi:Bacteriophage probable baseplate hub protein
MTDPIHASVSPVFTVAGERSPDLGRDCIRLEITEDTEGLRTLKAEFVAVGAGATGAGSDLRYLDGQIMDFGNSISVVLGPDGGQHVVFDGTVSGLEAVFGDGVPPRVLAYAEDAMMRLRMTRRMRTYTNVTDADIARQIADLHSLDSDVAADGPRFDVVQQVNQSDLAFLRERARRIQAELWCEGRTLHFSTRDMRNGTQVQLVRSGQLLSIRLLADLAHQRQEVRVTGFDSAAAKVIDEKAGDEVVVAESSSGRTGPQVVAMALGPSREKPPKPWPLTFRFRDVAQSGDQAKAWARAEMLRRARAFVTVEALTRGSPELVVGSIVELQDVGQPFSGGGYYVTRFCHTFDHTAGLRTRFSAERSTVNGVT